MERNPSEEPPCNSFTDEETIALRKKRSRRVSFADREITSVHIFKRDDEDSETPPESSADKQRHISEAENEVLGFFRDLADVDDSKDMSLSPIDDNGSARKSFLRPIESPSPGGSSTLLGSATSNDEENFFGPVSASFIRRGTLSDSAASDDNHDVTMDSTAFSMHFRSLVRSDSSGGNSFIEEKTPSHVTTPSDSGSFMVLTKSNKLAPQFSLSVEKVSGGGDSNDMSLVGDNPRNYDFGKLSPRLEALLAEGSKNLNDVSVCDPSNPKSLMESEIFMSNKNVDQRDCQDKETGNSANPGISPVQVSAPGVGGNVCSRGVSPVGLSTADMELDEANGILSTDHVDQINPKFLSCKDEHVAADISIDQKMETPNQQQSEMNNDCSKAAIGMNSPAISGVAPLSMDGKVIQFNSCEHGSRENSIERCLEETSLRDRRGNYGMYQSSDQLISPLVGYISPASAKQQQIFLSAAKSSRQLFYVTPSPKQPGPFLGKENIKSGENILSIHKSGSRFKIFEPSPLAYALKDGIERSKRRLSKLHSSTASPFNAAVETNCNGIRDNNMDVPVVNLEKHLFSVDQKNRHHEGTNYTSSPGVGNSMDHGCLSKNEGPVTLAEDGDSLIPVPMHIPPKEGSNQMMAEVASPFQLTQSQKKDRQDISGPEKCTQRAVVGFGSVSPASEVILDHINDSKTHTPDKFVLNPAKALAQKSLSSPTQTGEEVPMQRNEAFLCVSASPHIHKRIVNELSHMKSLFEKELSWSPSKRDLFTVSNDKNVQSLAEGIMPLNSNSNGPDHDDSSMEFSENSTQNTENSSVRKRRIKEPVLEEANHADKIRKIIRGPDFDKTQNPKLELMLERDSGSGNKRKMTGSDTAMKHWREILLKLLTDTQQLLSPLIDKLTIRLIGVLDDVLVHLQKIKIYEMLCFKIQSQKIYDQLSEVRNNRIAETKLLLYKLAYEKARQQLMSVKHERMLKRAQQLSSAVQKSQMLNLNRNCILLPIGDSTTIDENLANPSRVSLCSKDEVSKETFTMKKNELEALDRKITNLTKFFHSYCKMKGEPNSAEAIVLLNDHLDKKTSCRLIHEDLQLWEVDDFGSKNGKRNIVLNYRGLSFQRFLINDGPIPSISVSNKLNDLNIAKNFPNMDACLAFAYVLNTSNTKKHVGSKSFAQETQVTCSLLHNLLDVVGEVQLAQVEIRNLVQASFQSSSVEQLDLQLSFLDFNNGRKVTVTLDLTCLNCGVYPSDIFPYRIQASVAETYMPLPEPQSAKIKAAVGGLRVGYLRIIRLCRCISQLLQSLST